MSAFERFLCCVVVLLQLVTFLLIVHLVLSSRGMGV